MAHVEKRANRKKPYRVRYRGPDGRERSRSFARRTDADTFAATVETDKVRGAWVDPQRGKVLLREWAAHFMRSVVHWKPKTRVGNESLLRTKLLPAFGEWPLGRIETAEVREWVAGMQARGLSPSNVRQAYFLLRSMMEMAVGDGRLVRNPCSGIKLPKAIGKERPFLTAEQVETLAASIAERYDPTFVYLLAYGGLRWGEATGLRVARCDVLRSRVEVAENLSEAGGRFHWVAPKNYLRRVVKVPPFLRDGLAARIEASSDPQALVFTTASGTPLRYCNFMRSIWKPAVARAGLPPNVTPHVLRHTCGALLIAQGAHPKEIQVHLGHSSITVTMDIYGHLLPDQWQRLSDGLDAVFHAARDARLAAQMRPNGGPAVVALPSAGAENGL